MTGDNRDTSESHQVLTKVERFHAFLSIIARLQRATHTGRREASRPSEHSPRYLFASLTRIIHSVATVSSLAKEDPPVKAFPPPCRQGKTRETMYSTVRMYSSDKVGKRKRERGETCKCIDHLLWGGFLISTRSLYNSTCNKHFPSKTSLARLCCQDQGWLFEDKKETEFLLARFFFSPPLRLYKGTIRSNRMCRKEESHKSRDGRDSEKRGSSSVAQSPSPT